MVIANADNDICLLIHLNANANAGNDNSVYLNIYMIITINSAIKEQCMFVSNDIQYLVIDL